ncbi:MAG: STAS domain-containing protein [Planctomycetes bacterium]|nr:STAS domain-containing protein [Planctomycetota bacterium]
MVAAFTITSKKVRLPGGESAIVAEIGGAVDANTAVGFEEQVNRLLAIGSRYLVVNCSRLKYINSTGMGLFIRFSDQLAERGGSLELVSVPDNIFQLFSLLGLESLFVLHPDEKAAVKSILARARAGGAPPAAPAPTHAAAPAPPPARERAAPARERAASAGGRKAPEKPAGKPAAAAATPPPEESPFPLKFSCTGCARRLTVAEPGYFRCPRCAVFFVASPEGRVKAYHTLAPRRLEVKFPATAEFIEPLRKAVRNLATASRFSADAVDAIDAAIDETCSIVVRKCGGGGQTFEAFAVSDDKEFIIAVKLPDRTFAVEGKDPLAAMSMRIIEQSVDSVQFFDLPGKGQIAKLVKRHG